MDSMALNEAFQEQRHEMEDESESDEFECTDDSDDDPSFDIVEETRSAISKLSIRKPRASGRCKIVDDNLEETRSAISKLSIRKPRASRRSEIVDDNLESKPDRETVGDKIPELDKKDEKAFENVEQLIKAGAHLEKLTVDQCKVYLRKYGLRLTGNKGILISRIREHQEIIDGCGEKKYPPESFVFNCKGDACLGDVVIFEQNVYEMFSIASRSATGPPCGTRTVAGRIVKESYGVAKQQHTFTIEVLWSKGEKPLPPLHQLLIKGRNLYRIKTMRQRWVDERERLKALQEKHGRGARARYSREIRLNTKGMVIKRKNLTGDHHIPADKENQHPNMADAQQMNILNNQEHKQEQEVRTNVTSVVTTHQIDHGLFLQRTPQSILGKPNTAEHAVFSAQASNPQSPNFRNFQYMKHGSHKHHHRTTYHDGFKAMEYARPHHVHQYHNKARHHDFHGGGHLQHKNYSHHMNQASWVNHSTYVPLQQQHPEYRRQTDHYFSQRR